MCQINSSFFKYLQYKAKCLFCTVKFSLAKIPIPLTNWCFFKSILSNCFLLSSAFLQYFLLINLIMVFLVRLLDLSILWESPTFLDSTLSSISERIDVTVDSRPESWTLSGMALFSYCWHLSWSLSFSSCSLLMTISFRLITSSFKLLVLLSMILASRVCSL